MLTTLDGQSPVDAFVQGAVDVDPDRVPRRRLDRRTTRTSGPRSGATPRCRSTTTASTSASRRSTTRSSARRSRRPSTGGGWRRSTSPARPWRRRAWCRRGSRARRTGDFMPAYDPAGARDLLARPATPAARTSARSRSSPTAAATTSGIVTMLEQNLGVDDRLRHDGLRDLPGAAGDRPAPDLEHHRGSRTTRAPTTSSACCSGPGRPPTRVAGRRPSSTTRSRTRRPRPTRPPRPPPMPARWRSSATRPRPSRSRYGTSYSLVRDGLLGASQNGPRHPPAGRPRVGGRAVRRLRLPAALLAVGLASIAVGLAPPRAAAADEVSFGKPGRRGGLRHRDHLHGRRHPIRAARAVELRLRLPDTIGPFDRRRARAPGDGDHAAAVRPRRHRRRPHRAQHADHRDVGRVPAAGGDPVVSRDDHVLYEDTTHDWRTVKGDLMTVHWYAGDDAFANKALQIGEKAISDTAALLGVTETEPDRLLHLRRPGRRSGPRSALGRARTSAARRTPTSGRCSR